MSPLDSELKRVRDITIEYQVASEHHMHQMGTRFTIAGFYIAAMGFLLQSLVSDTSNLETRLITCALGFILTLPIWILELRTRQLIRLYARRMVQIEYEDMGIDGDGFTGVMSQIYESPPPHNYDSKTEDAIHSKPYRAKLALFNWFLPPKLGQHVSHSMGFDILYFLCLIFWLVVGIYFITTAQTTLPDTPTAVSPTTTPIGIPTPISTYTPVASIEP